MKIKGITLLSVEEYKKYRDSIRPIGNWWWLRSPGSNYNAATIVDSAGVYKYGYLVDSVGLVRPALIVEDAPPVGGDFIFGDCSWTVISDTLALADKSICKIVFRKDWNAKDANKYEASDVKKYLDGWLKSCSSTEDIVPWEDDVDSILRSMETVLESDKRTLKSPVSEEGWLYDAIHRWRKELSRIFPNAGTEGRDYTHTFCNRIITRGQDVCIVKDTCDGCLMNPERCAINDLLGQQGTLENWEKMELLNFREREEQHE